MWIKKDSCWSKRRAKVEFLFLAWGANIDISILVDDTSVIEYVAKFCGNTETVSKRLKLIIKDALLHGTEIGVLEALKVLRTFNRIAGRRDKCTQETHHLINSTPVAISSHNFTIGNFISKIRKFKITGENDNELVVKDNLDLYGKRNMEISWYDRKLCNEVKNILPIICLTTFTIA